MGPSEMTALTLLAQQTFWLPDDASTFSEGVGSPDFTFYFIYWVSVFFFLLITVMLIAFVILYRKRPEREHPEHAPHHSTTLEITWTIIPLILVLMMFIYGFKGFMNMATPPANAYDVVVVAQKWDWQFQYPTGKVSQELVVPVDRPVRLILSSRDVIHSLYVPAFRAKKDVVPGRYNKMWFEATEVGIYDLFCTEYCGTSHSEMITTCEVMDAASFQAWVEDVSYGENPIERGQAYWNLNCKSCHTIDGTANVGPTWLNAYGAQHQMADGSTITVDEQYIRESILAPNAQIVAGYQPQMPSFQGALSEDQIEDIIWFMKSISENWDADADPMPADEGGEGDEGDAADGEALRAGEAAEIGLTGGNEPGVQTPPATQEPPAVITPEE